MNTNWGNAVIVFTILFVSSAVLGNVLYRNSFVASLYARMAEHPGLKPWQAFGSMNAFLMLTMASGVVLSILYIALFALMRGALPASPLLAGLSFGAIVILIKAAPEAWNQYLNINYPPVLILTQLANSAIALLVTGLLLAYSWEKWPTIT